MGSVQQPLKVAVVGAGIGGLAAGIAFRNAGHQVSVYEKYSWTSDGKINSPLGNVLAIGANINRIIDRWGFDFGRAKATRTLEERVFNAGGDSLQEIKRINFEYHKEETGYDWYSISRGGLHNGLLDVARTTPDGFIPINIHTGQEVVGLDCKVGKITLKDGTEISSDLVVVADGVHSKLIHSITNNTTPAMKPGRTAYRFEVSAQQLLADPLLKPLYEGQKQGFTCFLVPEKGIFFLLMESDHGETFYGLLMHPAIQEREGSSRKWDVQGSKEELQKLAEAFHPAVRRVCELARCPLLWTITCRDPLKTAVNGRAVAIGDACHPHLPHHGQGAASSVEDAASLGAFFSSGRLTGPEDVTCVLRQWDRFRLPRATTVQLITMTYPTPIQDLEPTIRNDLGYRGSLPENVLGHEKPINTWLFNYDIIKEAQKHLTEIDRKA